MTKLEEEITKAFIEADYPAGNFYVGNHIGEMTVRGKAAAEVAKKYIEKAWWDGCYSFDPDYPEVHQELYDQWIKENLE